MSEEVNRQMSARLDEMAKRIDRLQSTIDAPKPKKPWYKPTTPGEFITFIGIPVALIAALWGFYDGVWLKLQRLDAATLTVAQDRPIRGLTRFGKAVLTKPHPAKRGLTRLGS